MIISFEITNVEDLNLLLQLTNRLGIKQVEFDGKKNKSKDNTAALNDEINDIFGETNADVFL